MRIDTLLAAPPAAAAPVGSMVFDSIGKIVYINKDGTGSGWLALNDGQFDGDVQIDGFLNVGTPSIPANLPGEAAFAGDVLVDGNVGIGTAPDRPLIVNRTGAGNVVRFERDTGTNGFWELSFPSGQATYNHLLTDVIWQAGGTQIWKFDLSQTAMIVGTAVTTAETGMEVSAGTVKFNQRTLIDMPNGNVAFRVERNAGVNGFMEVSFPSAVANINFHTQDVRWLTGGTQRMRYDISQTAFIIGPGATTTATGLDVTGTVLVSDDLTIATGDLAIPIGSATIGTFANVGGVTVANVAGAFAAGASDTTQRVWFDVATQTMRHYDASNNLMIQFPHTTARQVMSGTSAGVVSKANTDLITIGDGTLQGYMLMPGTNNGGPDDGSFIITSRYDAGLGSNANIKLRTYDGTTVTTLWTMDRLGNITHFAGNHLIGGNLSLLPGDLIINGTANIGSSAAPLASTQLTVIGTPSGVGGGQYNVIFADSDAMAQGVGGGISFVGKYTSGGADAPLAAIWGYKENATSGQYGGHMILGSRTHGSAISETLRLNADHSARFISHLEIDGDLNHDGTKCGFYATAAIVKQTGVAVTTAALHAAIVNLGLIAA